MNRISAVVPSSFTQGCAKNSSSCIGTEREGEGEGASGGDGRGEEGSDGRGMDEATGDALEGVGDDDEGEDGVGEL